MPKKQIQVWIEEETVKTMDEVIKKYPDYDNRAQLIRIGLRDLLNKIKGISL